MSGCDLISSLKDGCLDEILGVRDQIGANLAKTCIITRTWSGDQIGEGTYIDESVEVLPSPQVVNLSHSLRVVEGGQIKQGDLLLKMISQNQFPNESDIDGTSGSDVVEKFYRVNGFDYRVISVVKNYLTWDVQIRRLTDQTRR